MLYNTQSRHYVKFENKQLTNICTQKKLMATCIHLTVHECVLICVCCSRVRDCICSVVCVPGIMSVNVYVCEAVESRQASLLSFSSLPKREAKRGKAAPFNSEAEEKRTQKAQIKQMPESGLESQLMLKLSIRVNGCRDNHLRLSAGRPHRLTPTGTELNYRSDNTGVPVYVRTPKPSWSRA